MTKAYDIIKKPVLTEKSYADMADKKFTFEVAINANKTEIKAAIEEIFEGVKVESVNTMRILGKMKRQGRTQGRTPEVKKAIVTLKKDSKNIPFFEGMAEEIEEA
jgi:large subunit ribosomal protein L23